MFKYTFILTKINNKAVIQLIIVNSMSDQDKDKEPFTPTSFTGTLGNFFSAPNSKEDFD